MLEALREGGPRKREGGGARLGCAEDGSKVAIMWVKVLVEEIKALHVWDTIEYTLSPHHSDFAGVTLCREAVVRGRCPFSQSKTRRL